MNMPGNEFIKIKIFLNFINIFFQHNKRRLKATFSYLLKSFNIYYNTKVILIEKNIKRRIE